MKIGPRYNVYLGTRQTVWSRDINGTKYVFAYAKPGFLNTPKIIVAKDDGLSMEEVHRFTA